MTMQIVYKELSELKEYENNPRHNEQAIDYVADSIQEFGFRQPILIDKDNVIVAGHTRYKASIKLGLTKVPTILVDDLTDEQVKAYRLVDNKVSEYATWAFDKLHEELELLQELDLEKYGFEMIDETDFDSFFQDVEPKEKEEEEKEIQCPHCKMWFKQ